MRMRMIRILFACLIALVGIAFYVKTVSNSPIHIGAPENSNLGDGGPVAVVKVGKTHGQAKIGGHFELQDTEGKTRTEADYKGKFMVVYFGYSFCPDICPAALYNLTAAFNQMSAAELDQFAPLFVSVDPERDTVANMKLYMTNFHSRIVGLTGDSQQIEAAKKAYRVYAQKAQPDGTSTDYLIDHSSIVYLMDRQGRYISSFNHQTDPETIIKTLRAVL